MSNSTLSASDPLRAAAESFVARLRRGERPTLAEYTERYPDQATRIRELFPKILASERRAGEGEATGPFGQVEDTHHIPRTIGEYHIVREIGRGGMGIVYEAVQGSLGRQVALKILPSGPCSRGPFLERFRREARSAARLHHTNIVPVFGVGDHEGIHFYAMQYIEGLGLDSVLKEIRRRRGITGSAADLLAKTVNLNITQKDLEIVDAEDFELGPMAILPTPSADVEPSEQAPIGRGKELVELAETAGPRYHRSVARLGVQAAEALAYAHSQGVLHRDVKPSNLLLDRHGILWITDFGLAKAEGEDMTGTGDIVGTLRYMAPERFQAKSDARSDIYALGMTLYEMIALRPAFEDEDRLRLVERINRERPQKLRTLDPHVPHDLETIVLKAIQKESNARYVSAAELADDLRRFLSDRPIKARRATLWEEFARWCRRNPTVASLVAVVLCLLGATIWANYQLRAERDTALQQQKMAELMQKDANNRLRTEKIATAQARRSARKLGQRFGALDALSEARRIQYEPLLTKLAVASLALPDLRKKSSWEDWSPDSVAIDFDEAFERYARANNQGQISVRRLMDDSEIASLEGGGGPVLLRFSPHGDYLAVWHENDFHLTVWNLSGTTPTKAIDEQTNAAPAFDFDQSGKLFAYGRIDGIVLVCDLPSGKSRVEINVEVKPGALALQPSGNEIAVAVGEVVSFFDARKGQKRDERRFPKPVETLAWHPDGKHLAAGETDGTIHLAQRDRPSLLSLVGHRESAPTLVFSHNGELLVSSGADHILRMWDARTGRQLFATPTTIVRPVFSHDDKYLFAETEGTSISYWEVAPGREYRTINRQLTSPKATLRDGAISPDGRWLAMATDEGVAIWDFHTGEELAALPCGDTVGCLFMPSGSLLTSGVKGVFEWSLRNQDGAWKIGPPKQLANWACDRLARSRGGSLIAAATKSQGALVLDLDRPTIRNTLMTHEFAAFVTVSPDGSRIATGSQGGNAVRIWDATTCRLVRELPVSGGSIAAYSPDGRWLATNAEGGTGIQLWAADVLTKGAFLPAAKQSRIAFSPDGLLAAVESGQGSIRIYHTDREVLVVELEDPSLPVPDRANWIQFSPDGSQLVMSSNDSHSIHIWNLYELRADLVALRLDWDGPGLNRPFVEASTSNLDVAGAELLDPILQARWTVALNTLAVLTRYDDADAYCRRGAALMELGLNNLAMADFGQALRLRPEHAEASFLRGMELFRVRQWELAMEDFVRATSRPTLTDAARWMRGKALLQMDRIDDMMSEVNGLIAYYPRDPQLYYQRALGQAYRRNHTEAMKDLDEALRLGPSHDPALNNMAWILVTGPESMRDPERALTLVQRARTIAPQKMTYLNTFGVTLYRLKRYQEAVRYLEQSLEAGRGQFDGYDLFFMAMCRARLNQMDLAQQAYDRACEWRRKTRLTRHEESELEIFREEAESVLNQQKTLEASPKAAN